MKQSAETSMKVQYCGLVNILFAPLDVDIVVVSMVVLCVIKWDYTPPGHLTFTGGFIFVD